ncbi:hypothetical protein [Maribacter sp. 2307ULW6-5]|uniref:hypothetical protein n=1 Tax=Maribacter sp. 2307ULW6-5 TaxID=3386275 RepID=UPI0039BCCAD3
MRCALVSFLANMYKSAGGRLFFVVCGLGPLLWNCHGAKKLPSPIGAQYPAPMQEALRDHDRRPNQMPPGKVVVIEGLLSRPVTVYLSEKSALTDTLDLLVHFNGAAHIPAQAVHALEHPPALAVVHEGAGSSAYAKAFKDPLVWQRLRAEIQLRLGLRSLGQVHCSAFSAGYGAVRELLGQDGNAIAGLLLLDGLHTDYVPKGKSLAQGAHLNTEKLRLFLAFAREAAAGNKKMLLTHSAIFPGTYASTTETAHWLMRSLGIKPRAVLQWGPGGMQQLGEAQRGNFQVMSFAGNTAPDHLDHLHGLPEFLRILLVQR